MITSRIHFSNRLDALLPELKRDLFPKRSNPFASRIIVLPHLGLKTYLMQALANDPSWQVAAGVHIVNFWQALSKLGREKLPSQIQLGLQIQYYLSPLIENDPHLFRYFSKEGGSKRIAPFCDTLAHYFLEYAVFGCPSLPSWQQKLWDQLGLLTLYEMEPLSPKGKVALFGFSYLPPSVFAFFSRLQAHCYLLSPCRIFFGDFASEKEKVGMRTKIVQRQFELFDATFSDQNLLLSNWGKLGRLMQILVEESGDSTQEHYTFPPCITGLTGLQNALLNGEKISLKADRSVVFFSAITPLREVQVLYDHLLECFDNREAEPSDVQIFAPNIEIYAPLIQAVFKEVAFSIGGLGGSMTVPMHRAAASILDLPKNRFSADSVLLLLPYLKGEWEEETIRHWVEKARITWGFSTKQRRQLYLRDFSSEQIGGNASSGTWEEGLERLLDGIGQIEGKKAPLCAVSVTEIELFNRFYTLIHSLADDLAPLFDGTRWTIPTWLRYIATLIESYLPIDPSFDLYKDLHQLASTCDHLDDRLVSYLEIEGWFGNILSRKGHTLPSPHLQAVAFESLSNGVVSTKKVIGILGLQEGVWPSRQVHNSLSLETVDRSPTQADRDRDFALQIVHHARDKLILSYVRDQNLGRGKHEDASPIFEDLLAQFEGVEVEHHPASCEDSQYFGGRFKSYSQRGYQIALGRKHPKRYDPLIPSLYQKVCLDSTSLPEEISLRHLVEFARHPMRHYVKEVLGVTLWRQTDFFQRQFLLDPLTKKKLVFEALEHPFEKVWKKAIQRAEIPVPLLSPLAKRQILDEVEIWKEALRNFGVGQLERREIALEVEGRKITGFLEGWTPKGLCVWGKDCLEDRIRFWPQGLIMQTLGLPLLMVKDRKAVVIEGSLEDYLQYYELAKHHPSPMQKELCQPLLERDVAKLSKRLTQLDDDVWRYIFLRDPLPDPVAILANWSDRLNSLFGHLSPCKSL